MSLDDKGGRRLSRVLADPDYAQRIGAIRAEMRETDRAYAMFRTTDPIRLDDTPV